MSPENRSLFERVFAEDLPYTDREGMILSEAMLERLLNAARSVPLSVGVEEVARELYLSFWQRNGQAVEPFDATAPAIQAMWRHIADDAQAILSKLGREEDCSARADLSPASRSPTPSPAGIWRVCRVIRGECHQCPSSEEVHGEPCVRGCYLQAAECVNVVETGNPWRKTEGVKAPWAVLPDKLQAAERALTECADDLEAEIMARAGGELPRRIERDLGTVRRARETLSLLRGEGTAKESLTVQPVQDHPVGG